MALRTETIEGKTQLIWITKSDSGLIRYYKQSRSKYKRKDGTRKIIGTKRIGLAQYKRTAKTVKAYKTREIRQIEKFHKEFKKVEQEIYAHRYTFGRTWYNTKNGKRYNVLTSYCFVYSFTREYSMSELEAELRQWENALFKELGQNFKRTGDSTIQFYKQDTSLGVLLSGNKLFADDDYREADGQESFDTNITYNGYEAHVVDKDETSMHRLDDVVCNGFHFDNTGEPRRLIGHTGRRKGIFGG